MGFAKIYNKRPKILALWPFKNFKIKYGLKCLELFNSTRNTKIAKKFQKAKFYLTKLVSKYIHDRIIPSDK